MSDQPLFSQGTDTPLRTLAVLFDLMPVGANRIAKAVLVPVVWQ